MLKPFGPFWNWLLRLWLVLCALGLPIVLWPEANRMPLCSKTDWLLSEGFITYGMDPRLGDLPPETAQGSHVFWRSWSPTNNFGVGKLISAPFRASTPALALPVLGYPAAPGNTIFLENQITSERIDFRYGNAHETWQELVILLPDSWRKAPLKVGAIAGGVASVGIGSPSAAGWPTVIKRSLPASLTWHAVICLWLVILTALPRSLLARLDRRLAPNARWVFLPLACALTGYTVFFTYALSPQWTIGIASLLSLAGIVHLRQTAGRFLFYPGNVLRRRPVVLIWLGISLVSWLCLNAQQTVSTSFSANYRFTPASWSTDNQLPLWVAEGLHRGDPLTPSPSIAPWQVSDRPPAFTGLVALLRTSSGPLFSRPGQSQLFPWIANLLGIFVMSSWVFPVWACLKRGNIRGQARLWIVGTFAFTPFLFFNTVYVWPKLLSASLALSAWLLLDPKRPGRVSPASSIGAGLAFGAALLAHGGIFFSHLAMAIWLSFTQLRQRWGSLLIVGLVFFVTVLPWLAWVSKVDPPGNALTKSAFAGTFGFNERNRSLKDTVIRAYASDTFERWMQRKTQTLKAMLGIFQPIEGSHLGWADGGLALRRLQFFNLLPTIGICLLFLPGLARSGRVVCPACVSRNGHFGAGVWFGLGLLTILIQLALFWNAFILAEISYGAVVCLHLGLFLAGLRLAPLFRLATTAAIALNLIAGWLIEPALTFGHSRVATLAFALVLATVSAIGISLIAFRRDG